MVGNTQTLTYLISFRATDTTQAKRKLQQIQQRLSGLDVQLKKTGKSSVGAGMSLTNLARRAALTIPIWFALRAVFMAVIQLITSSIKEWAALEVQMARVSTVTRGTKNDLGALRDEVQAYGLASTRSFSESAKAMYALGSAGLTVGQQMSGFKHIMDLTIATFGNTEQVAKLVAGSFNVFGDSLQGAYSDAAKFQRIADVLAGTYSKQQVELSEIATAMTYVASIGGLLNVSFEDLVGTIGFLNTGMLKGTKSGTSLMNAFIRLGTHSEKLRDLGVMFDATEALDFRDVMQQLVDIYGQQGLSMASLRDLMETFGRRGGRAVAQIIKDFDRWKIAIGDANASFEGFAEYMQEQAEDTLPAAFSKLGNAIKLAFGDFITTLDKALQLTERLTRQTDKWSNQRRGRNLFEERGAGFFPRNDARNTGASLGGLAIPGSPITQSISDNIYEKYGEAAVQMEAALTALQEMERLEEKITDYKSKAGSSARVLEEASEKYHQGLLKEKDLLTFIAGEHKKIFGYHTFSKQAQKELNEALAWQILQQKQVTRELELQIGKSTLKKFSDLNLDDKVKTFGLGNVTDTEATLFELTTKVAAANGEIAEWKLKNLDSSVQELSVAQLIAGEQENIILAYESQATSKKDLLDITKLAAKFSRDELEAISKIASEVRGAISGPLTDVLQGESTLLESFDDMGEKISKIINSRIAEGLTDMFVDATGLDMILGRSLTKQMTDVNTKHITGVDKVLLGHTNRLAGLMGKPGEKFSTAGGFVPGVGQVTLPGFGPGGIMNRMMGSTGSEGAIVPIGQRTNQAGRLVNAYGAVPGRGIGQTPSALLGVASSSLASGIAGSQSGGMVGGVLGGIGGLGMGIASLQAGAAAGTMFGAGGLLGSAAFGPIGLIAGIGAMIYSLTRTPPKWSKEESREQTSQIGSKIDTTNRQLEWVNRNLVALRQEITFILPESAYFAENRPESTFALDSLRGVS